MDQYPMIGSHLCTFEEPDIIFMRLDGPVSSKEGSEINRLHREFGDTHDHVFFLIDLKDLESIHPDTRKESGEVLKDLPLRGAAVYQAGFKAKVLAKLIFTAMNLFRPEEEKAPIEFFDTESEARAWIESLRRKLGYSVEADENAA